MKDKKFLPSLMGVMTVTLAGAVVFGASSVEIPHLFSQGSIQFNTPTGILSQGEYGITDSNQIFANIDGEMIEYNAGEIDYTTLEEVDFIGSKYEDVFEGGEKKEITKQEYDKKRDVKPIKKRRIRRASAAIANEATAQADGDGYVNSLTLAIDCTETDRGVLTFVAMRTLGDITGVTHNGDAMAAEVESLNNGVAGVEIYSRVAADSGNNNVVVSLSDYRLLSMFNICLSGTDQSDLIEATQATDTGWSTAVSDSVTSVTDGAWVFTGLNLQSAYALAPDAGETELNDSDHSDGNLGQFGVSYILDATAGSETMGWSWSTGDNYAMALGVVKPSGEAPPVEDDKAINNTILFE